MLPYKNLIDFKNQLTSNPSLVVSFIVLSVVGQQCELNGTRFCKNSSHFCKGSRAFLNL